MLLGKKIGIDIVGMFSRSSYTHQFAITSVDYYSKWPDVRFTQRASTADIICSPKEAFSPEGIPMEIVSDNGVQFCSDELRLFLRNYSIRHTRTSLYYPQANGEVERFNRVLMDCIQAADVAHEGRVDAVQRFLMEYRSTPHCVTEVSPWFLIHGRIIKTKLHVASNVATQKNDAGLRQTVQRKENLMMRAFNKSRKTSCRVFKEEDVVRVRKQGIFQVFVSSWRSDLQGVGWPCLEFCSLILQLVYLQEGGKT
ncbi:hypothetical protein M513_12419 [Trichuris suis]|uniref:Integrase catalytic domain-containing protein n=1 Tax=Trichuris suis TaxID=68888 RepID=A0A085LP13_9BILA|nr:hypothetical protein M513_12419 [Trichuris suis]